MFLSCGQTVGRTRPNCSAVFPGVRGADPLDRQPAHSWGAAEMNSGGLFLGPFRPLQLELLVVSGLAQVGAILAATEVAHPKPL